VKPDTMYHIALGAVIDLFEAAGLYAEYTKLAESADEHRRFARRALKYKALAVVGFDREMDRLVKEYK